MIGYMILFTLHEWEENRILGGFSKLMAKFFGLDVTKEKEELSHLPVAIFGLGYRDIISTAKTKFKR